jgi:hypothetical protein
VWHAIIINRTVPETTKQMVDQLRALDFTKMRTRLIFKGQKYLAEKEPGWSTRIRNNYLFTD